MKYFYLFLSINSFNKYWELIPQPIVFHKSYSNSTLVSGGIGGPIDRLDFFGVLGLTLEPDVSGVAVGVGDVGHNLEYCQRV